MNTQIVPQNSVQPRDISPNNVNTAIAMSKIAWQSGAFGASSPEQAAMVMLKAYELGFPMTAASEFIEVIDGKSQLKPLGAMAVMRAHPEVIRSVSVKDLYDIEGQYYGCECTIERYEAGRVAAYTKQFTLQDAAKAELIRPKSNWEKYPKQMCQWRAVGFCADIACPDLLSGMTGLLKRGEAAEDIGDFEFDSTPVTIEPANEQTQAEALSETQGMTLQKLCQMYPMADILAVTNGVMPQTVAECETVAEKLAKGGEQ